MSKLNSQTKNIFNQITAKDAIGSLIYNYLLFNLDKQIESTTGSEDTNNPRDTDDPENINDSEDTNDFKNTTDSKDSGIVIRPITSGTSFPS
ncbi:16221_t:CDS:2 [Cetraspora pellucida]|uniref:16221_t:CDS:1 n=1 Tax=Cetraspora pellucida TaxID=1433469 RepID=A0A9N8VQ88_9GLOM|nr:16221_t:CDS:2 [Cetraspora pellucida]